MDFGNGALLFAALLRYNIIMEKLKKSWLRIPSGIRKIFVFTVGWAVVIAGVAMLVLPGPGWATIFLGFAILATEFARAHRVRNHMVRVLEAIIDYLKKLWKKLKP